MASTGKLMNVGISLVILTIIITTVMAPIISGNLLEANKVSNADTINAIIKLFPLFLGVGGLLAITSLFTGKK